MNVTIGISNHHVHITEDDFKLLFGEKADLEKQKDLNQPGQFASYQKVNIETVTGKVEGLRILGPYRNYTQVELSQTDCRKLKITAPVRSSGCLDGAALVTIVGPCGRIERYAGIIADRHIHITPEEREKYGLVGIKEVSVRVDTIKGGVFDHVQIKEENESYFELHLDTDDANGFLIENGQEGQIIM